MLLAAVKGELDGKQSNTGCRKVWAHLLKVVNRLPKKMLVMLFYDMILVEYQEEYKENTGGANASA